jgi:hypothetical protein
MMPDPPDMGVPAVFMTGENVEPDMSRCDYAVTFSRVTPDRRHLRCPEWVAALYADAAAPSDLLLCSQRHDEHRQKFCALIARNLVPNREAMAIALSKFGTVDAPSGVLNNCAPIGPRWSDKVAFLRSYRFAVAFENVAHSGYTTEKLPDALYAGTVPLYWGDPDVSADFNPRRFLNLADHSSIEELAEEVARLNDDPMAWRAAREQPAYVDDRLPECADEERLFAFWGNIFDEALALAGRSDPSPSTEPQAESRPVATIHQTIVYLDAGEPRHGRRQDVPDNLRLVQENGCARFVRRDEHGTVEFPYRSGTDETNYVTDFEIAPVRVEEFGLKAKELFLCAEPDGAITLSRTTCDYWEQFHEAAGTRPTGRPGG